MADYSSLGVFGGYYGQQQAAAETEMLKALAPIQVEQAGAKLQETQLEIQQKTFDLKNAESLYARQQAMLRAMDAKQNTGAPGDLVGKVNSEAEVAAHRMFQEAQTQHDYGFYKESNDTAEKASAILENNSKVQTRAYNVNSKMLDHARDLLSAVHNERDWDGLRMQFPQLYPDDAKQPGIQQILQMKYPGPQGIKAMVDSLTSQKERAQTAATLAEAKARTAAANKDDEYTSKYLPALERVADARAKVLEKSGTPKVNETDVNQMTKLIMDQYPDADDKRAFSLARSLALDAAVLQARGMSKPAAQDEAIRQAGPSYFKRIRYPRNVAGATPDKPLTLPDGWDGDMSQLKDGMYYINGKGQVAVADVKGGGFVAPNARELGAENQDLPVDLDEGDTPSE